MAPQRTITELRINNIISGLNLAITLVDELHDALGTTSLQAIAQTTLSLVTALQNAKKNRTRIHPTLGRHPTTRKIHTYLEAREDGNRIRSFFRQNVGAMQEKAANLHKELLEIVSSLSDGTNSDRASSMYHTSNSSQMSSKSFSMLPSKPKIFHGRDSELDNLVKILSQKSARLQFWGPVVWGKQVSQEPLCIMKMGVEELLSWLTEIPHLAVMITMRGAERPASVCWTKPFLPPLQPLSDDAARQTFFDIADEFHESKHLDQVLRLTDNMPLAVDLIAHLVDNEGCSSVLARWEREKTSLLSVGHGRRSNLDASIAISLSSPRLTSSPGAVDLLRLLSILPDGLSNIELLQSCLPIRDVLTCTSVLVGTSLAYQDGKKRLKSLVPIREHMQHFHSPPLSLIQPLQKYFYLLLDLYKKYHGSQHMATNINQIISNFGNLNQILLRGLQASNPDAPDAIMCTLSLSSFSRLTGRGWLYLVDHIPAALPYPSDHKLEVEFIIEVLSSSQVKMIDNADLLVSQATAHFCHFNDPVLEAQALAIQTQKLARLSGYLYTEADALLIDAGCCRMWGNLKQARDLLRLCSMSGGTLDNQILNDVAEAHLQKSEYADARQIHTESAQATSLEQNVNHHAVALLNIAQIDVVIGGNAQDVTTKLHDAKALFSNSNYKEGIIFCEIIMANLKFREGDTSTARAIFQKYLQWPWIWVAEISFACLEYMADIDCWSGTYVHQTSIWAVIYLAYANRCHTQLKLCKALQCLGNIFLANKDEVTAESLFTVALDGFTYMDVHRSRADCMLCLGDVAGRQGQLARASTLWKDARPLFERSLQAKGLFEVDGRLANLKCHHETDLAHLAELNVPIVPLQKFSVGPKAMGDEGEEVEVEGVKIGVQTVECKC
ncbi:hypothetical protein B0H14DRAFT_2557537 [Mycena olivaceomarginata]|nr:hypothetical protein B0H14DRAFT_2557537 [Mycena olivaceomarginata]